ncbi:GlxA family transcriptional regulator [Litorivivens sp.]|uniref:GlxA family transcriptional regulator n=1 Tax=Litorivivens sp. TaxID=2020868 RepID=UPI00356AC7A0
MVNIALIALPNALTSSISLPAEMLNAAADQLRIQRQPAPRVSLVGLTRQKVNTAGGLVLEPDLTIAASNTYDLIILPTRWRQPLKHINVARLSPWLRSQYDAGATLCTVGTGSYLLAEAGLLEKRPATTHWHYFDDFAQRYPQVELIRNYLITESERIYCAGSINSIADLLVHLIGERWGTTVAHRVERQFSPEIRRPFHSHAYRVGQTDLHRDEAIAALQSWLAKHLHQPIALPDLAVESGLSTRSLSRRFKRATGQSPLDYLNTLRLRAARELLQQSNLAVGEIAQTVGIGDPNYFSRLFRREYGETPVNYRRNVRDKLFRA